MEGSADDGVKTEILPLSDLKLGPASTAENDVHDLDGGAWGDDGFEFHDSIEEPMEALDLDREWQRRRDQFHTIGYREGLMAGKEASAQEGFNAGFGESVSAGYNWGLIRGVTSALTCLPERLGERLVETEGKRMKLQQLYESVSSLSTTEALKLFNDNIIKQRGNPESSSCTNDLQDQCSDSGLLASYYGDVKSLILESPAIQVHLELNK